MANDVTKLRWKLLARGYHILPAHGKKPALGGWNAKNYVATQISDCKKGTAKERVESWERRKPLAVTTGIRIENGVVAVDLDCDDAGAVEACLAALPADRPGDPKWDQAPTRFGGGAHKMALFGRLVGDSWIRVGSNKYKRQDGTLMAIEIFGGKPFTSGVCSRQFTCYGPRSYVQDENEQDTEEVLSTYEWAAGLPDLTQVDARDLPRIDKDGALAVVTAFEAYAAAQGWEVVEDAEAAGDGSGMDVFDIDRAKTRFAVQGVDGDVSYKELEAMVAASGNGSEIRVAAFGDMVSVTNRADRCTVYWSKRFDDCIVIKDWQSFNRHYPADKAPMPPDQAKAKIGEILKRLMHDAQEGAKDALQAGEAEDGNGGTASNEVMPPRPRNLTNEERMSKEEERWEWIGERMCWLLMTHAFEGGNVVNIYQSAFTRFPSGLSERATRSAFANWTILREGEGPRGGNLPPISAFDMWLANEYRMESVGIAMRPDTAVPVFVEDGLTWRNRYQNPRHWEVKVTKGQIAEAGELFGLLIANVAAEPREQTYVLQYIAYKMMHPDIPGCGILFVNPIFGSGRDLLYSIVAELLGVANCTKQDVRKVIGKDGTVFNAWVANKILAYIPEVLDPEHARGTYEKLKGLIDPRPGQMSINSKGIEEFDGMRFASVWGATNHTDALRIEDDDRRLSVLYGVPKALDEALAIRLEEWRVKPWAIAALWRYMQTVDLKGYKPWIPLKTAAKLNMIDAAKDPARAALQTIAGDTERKWSVFTIDQLERQVENAMGITSSSRGDKTRNMSIRHKAARAGLVVPIAREDANGNLLRDGKRVLRLYCFLNEAQKTGVMSKEELLAAMPEKSVTEIKAVIDNVVSIARKPKLDPKGKL
jgi:hypothetical protein